MTSFWLNKPVKINENDNCQILSNNELLLTTNEEINRVSSKVKLNYIVHNKISNKFVDFINKNYINSSDDTLKLIYTTELMSFYNDSLIIEFNNKSDMVGFIIGNKSNISINGSVYKSSEVNFLCVIPELRKLHVSSYMINILTKEMILRCNIGVAHYTIHEDIKSDYFSKKRFYHIPINIAKLTKCNFFGVSNYTQKEAQFFSDKSITLKYINNNINDRELYSELYDKVVNYNKLNYSIYDYISFEKFKLTFINKSFHHFILYDNNDKIISYICLFNLDTLNILNNESYKNGNIFFMFFERNKISTQQIFNVINEYISKNCIFDVISFTDIFKNEDKLECIRGSCVLKYYLFNMNINLIENYKNGLITI